MKQVKLDRREINTPVPNPKHTYCSICNNHYHEGEYKQHIRSDDHAQSVKASEHIYSDIDAVINQMNDEFEFSKAQKKLSEEELRINQAQQNLRLHESSYDIEESYSQPN